MISRPNCSCIDNNERHTLPNQHIISHPPGSPWPSRWSPWGPRLLFKAQLFKAQTLIISPRTLSDLLLPMLLDALQQSGMITDCARLLLLPDLTSWRMTCHYLYQADWKSNSISLEINTKKGSSDPDSDHEIIVCVSRRLSIPSSMLGIASKLPVGQYGLVVTLVISLKKFADADFLSMQPGRDDICVCCNSLLLAVEQALNNCDCRVCDNCAPWQIWWDQESEHEGVCAHRGGPAEMSTWQLSKQRAFYRWFSFVCVGYSALDVEENCGHCTEEALQTLIGALLLNAPFAHFS